LASADALASLARAAFGGFENLTGYVPGFAFILSFLSPVWTICSFDCAVSISEEASNAAIAVPYAIIGAIVSAGGLGTLILIILSLTMGTDLAMLNDTDQPLAQIYLMAFGKNGATAIWVFMCIAGASRVSPGPPLSIDR
jgi:amino acid transporter